MAARDIMPFTSPHGGITEVRWATFTASETFEIGEPISSVDAGTFTEAPVGGTEWIITDLGGTSELGIAAWGPGASNLNPVTGIAYATGDYIPYWPVGPHQLFITSNFFVAGGGTEVAPDLTDIGEGFQIVEGTATTRWGIERTTADAGLDVEAVIVEVLDAKKAPIRVTGQTGTQVVFRILQPSVAAA